MSADSDVAMPGTNLIAWSEASSTTLDGVHFSNSYGGSNGSFTASGAGTYSYSTNAFTSSNAPFSNLSANYQLMASGSIYWFTGSASALTDTVDLTNLTPFHLYEVRFWVNDPRGFSSTETRTEVLGGLTTSSTLDFNSTGADGGSGQFITGMFDTLAAQTSETFTITTADGVVQMNDLELNDVTSAPEPSSFLLFGLACGGLCLRSRPRRGVR